jgi:hypothetical protein
MIHEDLAYLLYIIAYASNDYICTYPRYLVRGEW